MTAPADSFFPTKVLSIHQFFCFFLRFFPFIIDNCNCESLFRKGIRMKIFLLFTIIYPKMNVADKFESAINLPTHIRENTDFSWQKPRQLPTA